jgi:pimeloyl-ACP methyl ester carboxylesterase
VRRRVAAIGAGVAAGAVAAGALTRTVMRRRTGHHLEADLWDLPPDDLGHIESFDGTRIAVRAAGDPEAPVLLFVHGFSLDMTTWHEQWVDLSTDFRCVLMDQRGHGRSGPAAHGNLSMRAMGRDVAAVLDSVAPRSPAMVIGHSMGGIAAIAMAEQRPELFGPRVAGLILVGTSSDDLLHGAIGSITGLLRRRPATLSSALRRVDHLRRAVMASPGDIRAAAVRLTQFGPDAPPHLVDHVVHLAQRATSDVWTDGLAELMEVDLQHAMPRAKVPTLVIVGEYDRVTPPASAIELAGELPDARLVVITGAGHLPMLERPVELDREIRMFAKRVLKPTAQPRAKARTRKKAGT